MADKDSGKDPGNDSPIPADGTPYCAFVRKNGLPCCNKPLPGEPYCQRHTRKTRYRGLDNPGRTPVDFEDMDETVANILPPAMRERFLQAIDDAKLTSYRSDLALIELRRLEHLERFAHATGEATAQWMFCRELVGEIRRLLKESREARAEGDEEEARRLQAEALRENEKLFDSIDKGASREKAWEELEKHIHRAAIIKKLELERMRDLHQMLTTEQFLLLTEHLMDSVRRHVKDETVVTLIGQSFDRALEHGEGVAP